MFGIGFGELVIFLVVALIAVGPDKMPTFLKAVGKGLREFRRTTRELRSSVGIDELLRDEDLRELRRPIDLNAPARRPSKPKRPAYELTDDDAEAEFPADGTDIVHLRAHPPREAEAPEPEPSASTATHSDSDSHAADPDAVEPEPVAREDEPVVEPPKPPASTPKPSAMPPVPPSPTKPPKPEDDA